MKTMEKIAPFISKTLIIIVVCSIFGINSSHVDADMIPTPCKSPKCTSMDLNESLNSLRQDDENLIEMIKNHYLFLPSRLEYNFSRTSPDMDGQFNQAAYIANTFFSNFSKEGFFVEAGAYDGETISNTLLFEKNLGWTGLLVEPNPIAFENMIYKRRKSWAINACLSTNIYPETIMFDAEGIVGGIIKNGILTSTYQKIKPKYRRHEEVFWKRKNISTKYGRIDMGVGVMPSAIKMQCLPLYSILKAVGVVNIDYFSLDVEGAEYDIMQSLLRDKGKIKLRVASIENTYADMIGQQKSELELTYFMSRNGYHIHKKIGEDDIFVRN